MGLLPTYAVIGVAASALLVALRFFQGIALGGEWAGAVIAISIPILITFDFVAGTRLPPTLTSRLSLPSEYQ